MERAMFVSFAMQDSAFAGAVVATLQKAEFTARLENDADCASGNQNTREDHLREALAVVVILSPDSVRSPEVTYEWAFAIGCGVPVLPLILGANETELHPRLNTIQHLNFSNHARQPWDLLLQSLRHLQSLQVATTVRVPRDQPPVVQRAALALDSTYEKERTAALASLGQMHHPAAVELLAEAARHPVRQVRFGAAIHLAAHKDARAVPALLEAIALEREEVAPWMLAKIGPSAVPLLLQALHHDSQVVQDAAVIALGLMGGSDAVAALIDRLQDPAPENRVAAATRLQYSLDPAALPALLNATKDPMPSVRTWALDTLVKYSARFGTEEQVFQAFWETLDDESDQVGMPACEGLKQSGDARAIPRLIEVGFRTSLKQIAFVCRRALEAFGHAAGPALRILAAETNDAKILGWAVSMLGRLHDETDRPLFIRAARHASSAVRVSAVVALDDERAKEAVPVLLERLDDDVANIRQQAVYALGKIGDRTVVPRLIECLEDDEIVDAVVSVLNDFATKQARASLRTWRKEHKK